MQIWEEMASFNLLKLEVALGAYANYIAVRLASNSVLYIPTTQCTVPLFHNVSLSLCKVLRRVTAPNQIPLYRGPTHAGPGVGTHSRIIRTFASTMTHERLHHGFSLPSSKVLA